MPLTDRPPNVPVISANLPNAGFSSPNNKENFAVPKQAAISSIPVRTPSKDPKGAGGSLTPKLRKGNLFSKSSSDLFSGSHRTQQVSKPGYMAATAATKFRGTGPDPVFVEPPPPAPSGSTSRFVSSNPFK